jgi:hypothetical protein
MACTAKNAKTIAIAKALTNTPWCDDYEKMISGMVSVQLFHFSTYLLTEERADMTLLFPN